MIKMEKLDKAQMPLTKITFEHPVNDLNQIWYIEGFPCDIDVAEITDMIMDENFNNIYGELTIKSMEFLGVVFIDKETAKKEIDKLNK